MDKYGKTSAGFPRERALNVGLEENARQLAHAQAIEKIYTAQPKRVGCKLCEYPFDKPLFSRRGISHYLCTNCGHLTSNHEDTPAFHDALYVGENAPQAQDYKDADKDMFEQRVRDIYRPKADFLAEHLGTRDADGKRRAVADLGAGAGHMVKALRDAGFNADGFELNTDSVLSANAMIGCEALHPMPNNNLEELTGTLEQSIVTAIFVLEHIADPVDIMKRLAANPNIEYLLAAVPLFGFGPMSDELFPSVRPRVLAFGHTHVFTSSSLDWICRETGWRAVARWWFGGDAMDLVRAAGLCFRQNAETEELGPHWSDRMSPLIDDLQLVLDRHGLSSEVHILLEKETSTRASQGTTR